MGYAADKTYGQLAHEVRDRKGRVIEGATFTLKNLDGTAASTVKDVLGNILGSAGGGNPAFSDQDGYLPPHYRHGDYIAEWTAYGDTTSRYLRIPPIFEDFGMVDVTKYDNVDPTGVADSYLGIEQAIADCAGRFKLFFPPGNYRIGTRVTLLDDTYLVGAGSMFTRIFGSEGLTGAVLFADAVRENIVIENLTLDGLGAARNSVNPILKFTIGCRYV